MPRGRRTWHALALGAALVLFDQLTKMWGRQIVAPTPWEHGFFLQHSESHALTLGLLDGDPRTRTIALTSIVLSLLAISLWFFRRRLVMDGNERTGLVLWAAGGLSNGLDLIAHGWVENFVHVELHLRRAWLGLAFNVADIAIVVGGAAVVMAAGAQLVAWARTRILGVMGR